MTENQAQDFLVETLFQYFTKQDFEANQGIRISDDEWDRFLDDSRCDFADLCGALASQLWEESRSDYEYQTV